MKRFATSTIITTLINIFRKTMNYSGGNDLSEELLPLSSLLGYYRPFFLNSREALVVE